MITMEVDLDTLTVIRKSSLSLSFLSRMKFLQMNRVILLCLSFTPRSLTYKCRTSQTRPSVLVKQSILRLQVLP